MHLPLPWVAVLAVPFWGVTNMRAVPFIFPYIAGTAYAPGPQPYSPGESVMVNIGGLMGRNASPQMWPGTVPTLRTLASNPGTPRARASIPVVDNFAPLPSNYLYIDGFVSKSKG